MMVLGLLMAFSMVLSACGPKPTPEATPPPATQPPTRKGAWVDQVVFTEQNSAEASITQLQAGDIDIYAYTIADPNLFATVKGDPNLTYNSSVGSANEMTFNPAVCTDTTKLNPFTDPKIREATNWLIDRNYVSQEIFGGLSQPKFFALVGAFPDYARYVDTARELEAYYAYNPTKANEIIATEMTALGATLVDGKWQFNNAPVSLIILIRTEDKRRLIGDYFATQLESVGFTVDRQFKTRSEASPIWVRGNPTDCLFNVYTGGWITTAVSRDDGSNFSFYYTPRDYPIPLFQAYTPTAEFDEVSLKLRNNDFTSMAERDELFRKAMRLSLQDSVRVFVNDQLSFTPRKANLTVAYDLAGSVAGAQIWPFTLRFEGQEGGSVKWAQPGIMVDPWNPVAGSNWIYDMTPIRATGDWGVISDPYTGLAWPQRIERAELVVKTGLPVAKILDWVTLTTADEIKVPADAWVDWDATNQKFITAAEKYPDGTTAMTKSTAYYPADFFTTVKWHDGNPMSMGDIIMGIIMTFDPGKPESAIYDAAQAETLGAFLDHFKGVKIVSTDPLVIETYDDLYQLDAERSISTWFPMYAYGEGAWHTIALGVLADIYKEAVFSADKADELSVEWLSYISGPSLQILKKHMDESAASGYIPYAGVMGQYVTATEAATRWANLQAWYVKQGHFWVGSGPFYLDKVYPVEGTITLQRFADYPDPADKWDRFGTPKIADVEVTGTNQVKIGTDVTFDVAVTFQGAPYPSAEIKEVKYLVFDAKGALVATGTATLVADGQYQIVLSGSDVTSKLVAGSNKIEVAVSSLVVSIPTFGSLTFVTAP